jgi:nitric oxide dioxygenase
VDGKPVLKAEPGQYIGLKLVIDGEEQRRNYSCRPCAMAEYRISVKREAGGKVSNYLHDQLQVGDTCSCSRQRASSPWPPATSRWC